MKTELLRTKKVYIRICRLRENPWQEFQYVNGTFDDELSKVDISEIRELLDEKDYSLCNDSCNPGVSGSSKALCSSFQPTISCSSSGGSENEPSSLTDLKP